MSKRKSPPGHKLCKASGLGGFDEIQSESYPKNSAESSPKSLISAERQAKIAERRVQIPRAYKATYDKAIKGKSLRAAINAQCLECVCWQRKEITLCTDLACPLYAVRPYQIPQNGHEGGLISAESQKSGR